MKTGIQISSELTGLDPRVKPEDDINNIAGYKNTMNDEEEGKKEEGELKNPAGEAGQGMVGAEVASPQAKPIEVADHPEVSPEVIDGTANTPETVQNLPQSGSAEPAPVEATGSIPPFEPVPVQSAPVAAPTVPASLEKPENPSPVNAASIRNLMKSLSEKGIALLKMRHEKKLTKIVARAAAKKSITNADVEKKLRVSDATATRYLAELVKQGKLRRTGNPHRPKYELAG